jgi:hypothetical protein
MEETDAAARKAAFIGGHKQAAAAAAAAAAEEEEAKLSAMDLEQREAYLAEKAERELHEKRKGKMLSKTMKGYKSSGRSKILGGKKGKRRKKAEPSSSSDDEDAPAAAPAAPATATRVATAEEGESESGGASAIATAAPPPVPSTSDATSTPMHMSAVRRRSFSDSPFVKGIVGLLRGKGAGSAPLATEDAGARSSAIGFDEEMPSPSYPSRPRVLSNQLGDAVATRGRSRTLSWEGRLRGKPLVVVVVVVIALIVLFALVFLGGSALYIVCGGLGLCRG